MQIGLECFKDEQLCSMIESNGRIGNCDITYKKNCVIYDTDNDDYLEEYFEEIIDIFTVAKYLKIDESDRRVRYLSDFLITWDMFNVETGDIQKILIAICKNRYSIEENLFTEKVTIGELFSADDLERNSLLKTYTWEDFCYSIKHINRYHSQQVNFAQLDKLLENIRINIPKGSLKLYRARICDEKSYMSGYLTTQMGAPPVQFASSGRSNSEGIQCLYLASDAVTTFHEVRAREHDHITVGVFEHNKDLDLVDLSLFDKIGPFSIPDFDMVWFAMNIEIIRKIGNEIAKPMRRFDGLLDYVPTQYICDYIKHLGYDGIKYKSTLSSGGCNYAIFKQKKFECVDVKLVEIESTDFAWKEI